MPTKVGIKLSITFLPMKAERINICSHPTRHRSSSSSSFGKGNYQVESYLHSSHDNRAWCMRKLGTATTSTGSDGYNSETTCCGNNNNECDMYMWIR